MSNSNLNHASTADVLLCVSVSLQCKGTRTFFKQGCVDPKTQRLVLDCGRTVFQRLQSVGACVRRAQPSLHIDYHSRNLKTGLNEHLVTHSYPPGLILVKSPQQLLKTPLPPWCDVTLIAACDLLTAVWVSV